MVVEKNVGITECFIDNRLITVKAARKDVVDLANLIPVMVTIQSDFRIELREPLLKPSISSDT